MRHLIILFSLFLISCTTIKETNTKQLNTDNIKTIYFDYINDFRVKNNLPKLEYDFEMESISNTLLDSVIKYHKKTKAIKHFKHRDKNRLLISEVCGNMLVNSDGLYDNHRWSKEFTLFIKYYYPNMFKEIYTVYDYKVLTVLYMISSYYHSDIGHREILLSKDVKYVSISTDFDLVEYTFSETNKQLVNVRYNLVNFRN